MCAHCGACCTHRPKPFKRALQKRRLQTLRVYFNKKALYFNKKSAQNAVLQAELRSLCGRNSLAFSCVWCCAAALLPPYRGPLRVSASLGSCGRGGRSARRPRRMRRRRARCWRIATRPRFRRHLKFLASALENCAAAQCFLAVELLLGSTST